MSRLRQDYLVIQKHPEDGSEQQSHHTAGEPEPDDCDVHGLEYRIDVAHNYTCGYGDRKEDDGYPISDRSNDSQKQSHIFLLKNLDFTPTAGNFFKFSLVEVRGVFTRTPVRHRILYWRATGPSPRVSTWGRSERPDQQRRVRGGASRSTHQVCSRSKAR